tara:strand:+ start:3533 stop:3757 length:225 start_codon:yes stop_codon:yes gene_type:complete
MKAIEEKIIEVLDELEKWEIRKKKVEERYSNGNADISELERIKEQINHYQNLLSDMKKKMNSTDISRIISRTSN